jgi:hypothetical protein
MTGKRIKQQLISYFLFTNYRRARLTPEYQMMSLLLSKYVWPGGYKLSFILRKKRFVISAPAAKTNGKMMHKRKEKRKINAFTGSANFF